MKRLTQVLVVACVVLCCLEPAVAEVSVCVSTSVVRYLVTGVLPPGTVVTTVMADDSDPHSFEPRPSDIKRLERCELIVLHGAGLESWGNAISGAMQQKVIRLFPDQRDAAPVARPHAWLSPKRLAAALPTVTEGMCQRLPERCSEMQRRSELMQRDLQFLSDEVAAVVATWRVKSFVSLHPTWRVFAEDYGLTECGVLQDSHAHEATPRAIKSLTERVRAAGEVLFLADAGVPTARYEWFTKDANLTTVVLPHQPRAGEQYVDFMRGVLEVWGRAAR